MGNCGAKTKVAEDVPRGLPSELTLKKKAELQTVLDADGIKREVCFEERETCTTSTSAFGVDVFSPIVPLSRSFLACCLPFFFIRLLERAGDPWWLCVSVCAVGTLLDQGVICSAKISRGPYRVPYARVALVGNSV